MTLFRSLPFLLLGLVFVGVGSVGVFSGGSWASFVGGGALLLALNVAISQRRSPRPSRKASCFAGLLLLLAWGSCWHAVDPDLSLYSAFKLTTILIPLILLSDEQVIAWAAQLTHRIPDLVGLMIVSVGALCLWLPYAGIHYGVDSGQVTKLNRGFSYILILFWPLAGHMAAQARAQSRMAFMLALFVGVVISALVLTHSRTSQLGAGLSVLTFGAAWLMPRVVGWGLGCGSILLLGWPFYAQYYFTRLHDLMTGLPHSWHHRVEIWDYFSYRIIENPWVGHGIGASHRLDWLTPHGAVYEIMSKAASHPHNAITQLWVELGAGGLAVFVALSLWALRGAMRLPVGLRPFALGCYTLVLSLLLFAYNFWTDSLWASMALTALAFAAVGRTKLSQS